MIAFLIAAMIFGTLWTVLAPLMRVAGPATAPENVRAQKIAIIAITLILSLGSLALYLYLGSPELPDRPYAARQADPDFRLNAAVEKIAADLAARPDANGYRRIAGMFYALHRFDRAVEACRKAIALGADDAGIWSQLGESLVMQDEGALNMDALGAFKNALNRDPADPRAGFYAGLAETQIGNLKKAVAMWRYIEERAPADAPWLFLLKEMIARTAKRGNFDPASVAPEPPALKMPVL